MNRPALTLRLSILPLLLAASGFCLAAADTRTAAPASAAAAGAASADMGRCLVAATSQDDKAELARWLFANAALHPDVAPVAFLSDAVRDDANRHAAQLIERLLTTACARQTEDAVRADGPDAIRRGFAVLGQVAMKELLDNAEVSRGFQDFLKYVDRDRLDHIGQADTGAPVNASGTASARP